MGSKADAGTEKSPQVYNGTSLCIHLLRQFYASHLYNAWQEDTKYGNILSGIVWSLTAKGTIYCITFALFIFIFSFFLLCCSVISMSQFPDNGKTTFYPSFALLMPGPKHFIPFLCNHYFGFILCTVHTPIHLISTSPGM